MARKTQTQSKRLLNRLLTGKNLPVDEAKQKLGINRLSARIFELREDGFPIYTNKVNVVRKQGNRFVKRKVTAYRLNTNALA
jgi:biotin operon repressor